MTVTRGSSLVARTSKTLCLLLLLVTGHWSLVTAVWAGAGTTVAEFLLIGAGARASAMGEAFVAVADDASAVYWNPGALSQVSGTQLALTHNELLSDIRYEYLAITRQTQRGTWGASLSYLHMGELVGRDAAGAGTKDFSAYDLSATCSYGRKVTEAISLGTTLRVIDQHLEEESASTIALDLGLLAKTFVPHLTAGLAVQHLGPGQKFADQRESLPRTIRAGLGYKALQETLTLGLDTSLVKDSGAALSLGGEYLLKKIVALRLGYKRDPETDSSVGLAAGMGFFYKAYRLDYAFVPFSDLGDTHRFSLCAKF